SVAEGMIDQTTSSVWLPCVNITGCGFRAASYFHKNQNRTNPVARKIMPVNTRMKKNRLSITPPWTLMFSGSQCPRIGHQPNMAHTNEPMPKTGTIKNSRLQNLPTIHLPVRNASGQLARVLGLM